MNKLLIPSLFHEVLKFLDFDDVYSFSLCSRLCNQIFRQFIKAYSVSSTSPATFLECAANFAFGSVSRLTLLFGSSYCIRITGNGKDDPITQLESAPECLLCQVLVISNFFWTARDSKKAASLLLEKFPNVRSLSLKEVTIKYEPLKSFFMNLKRSLRFLQLVDLFQGPRQDYVDVVHPLLSAVGFADMRSLKFVATHVRGDDLTRLREFSAIPWITVNKHEYRVVKGRHRLQNYDEGLLATKDPGLEETSRSKGKRWLKL